MEFLCGTQLIALQAALMPASHVSLRLLPLLVLLLLPALLVVLP